MQHPETIVMSKGNITTSFRISALITVLSNGQGAVHNMTIAQLRLLVQMLWLSVLKTDFWRVHLEVLCLHPFGFNCNCTLLSGKNLE